VPSAVEHAAGNPVRLQIADAVAAITLDSPPVNALTRPVIRGLQQALDGAHEARVVVLSSAVDGVFAAGADLELMRTATPEEFLVYLDELRALVDRVAHLDVPVVAVLDGHALGGGLELALSCTLRIATRRARLGVPEIRLGLIPGAGGTQRLPRLVGPGLAADLVLTGRTLDGDEAVTGGLVGRVCDPEELDVVVASVVGGLARASGPALTGALGCLRAASELEPPAGATVERDVVAELFAGPDAREGIAAFHERRAPRFTRNLAPRAAVAALVATALGVAAAADAQQEPPAHDEPSYGTLTIAITGDPATGSLGFKQGVNEAAVGDEVRFASASDSTTYHVVERSGLFALTVPPRGEARRTLEAGTHQVHDPDYSDFMHAVIRVPPDAVLHRKVAIRRNRRGIRARRVVRSAEVRWATVAPAAGHTFDVQRRRGGSGDWENWRTATTTTGGRFSVRAGDSWRIRVRTGTADARGAWSPAAPLTP